MESNEQATYTRIKICCIASVQEMQLAVMSGATALGFVSRMPSGPGPIEEALIAEIVPEVPADLRTFLLTCETSADSIVTQLRRTRVNTVQLVDSVEDGAHATIRDQMPDVAIVEVIHVTGRQSVHEAVDIAGKVDALRPIFSEYGLIKARVRVEVEADTEVSASPQL